MESWDGFLTLTSSFLRTMGCCILLTGNFLMAPRTITTNLTTRHSQTLSSSGKTLLRIQLQECPNLTKLQALLETTIGLSLFKKEKPHNLGEVFMLHHSFFSKIAAINTESIQYYKKVWNSRQLFLSCAQSWIQSLSEKVQMMKPME